MAIDGLVRRKKKKEEEERKKEEEERRMCCHRGFNLKPKNITVNILWTKNRASKNNI